MERGQHWRVREVYRAGAPGQTLEGQIGVSLVQNGGENCRGSEGRA